MEVILVAWRFSETETMQTRFSTGSSVYQLKRRCLPFLKVHAEDNPVILSEQYPEESECFSARTKRQQEKQKQIQDKDPA